MPDQDWSRVNGTVVPGHRVASGQAVDSPYPRGTIEMQVPCFQALGLDLKDYFQGTLNVLVSPHTVYFNHPEFTFRQVEWTDKHPPEDFSFSRCQVLFKGSIYGGWLYYPHPETKRRNFQNASILEIIAPPIPDLRYGDAVVVNYNALEVVLH